MPPKKPLPASTLTKADFFTASGDDVRHMTKHRQLPTRGFLRERGNVTYLSSRAPSNEAAPYLSGYLSKLKRLLQKSPLDDFRGLHVSP